MIDPRHRTVMHDYLRAKDEQRPHLMGRVFAPDARFTTRFATPTDFSDDTVNDGLAAITETFRGLGAFAENIYTVYAEDTAHHDADGMLRFDWLVAMQTRTTGVVRLAWGDYRWAFTADGARATELHVVMEQMPQLAAEHAPVIFDWMASLPMPWTTSTQIAETAPHLPALGPLRAFFGRRPAT